MTADEPGIPIPKVDLNGIYCAGCGETGTHAKTCPSRTSPFWPATAGDVAMLRGMIEACIEHGQYMNKELATLKDTVRNLINNHDHRIMCLEELQKDPAER